MRPFEVNITAMGGELIQKPPSQESAVAQERAEHVRFELECTWKRLWCVVKELIENLTENSTFMPFYMGNSYEQKGETALFRV